MRNMSGEQHHAPRMPPAHLIFLGLKQFHRGTGILEWKLQLESWIF